MIRVLRAFFFAWWHHGKQRDKEGRPYILHLVTVAWTAYGMTPKPEAAVVGLLHDYVEDVDPLYGVETLTRKFGWRTASSVKLLTRGHGQSYDQDSQGLAQSYMNAPTLATVVMTVKIADLLHNTKPGRGNLSEYKRAMYRDALIQVLRARTHIAVKD
jgi:(p)ppGpp synthase/HD superfamily hydrolase